MATQCFIDVDIDCYNQFHSERVVTARKDHTCCECRKTIHPGERYEYVFMVTDDIPKTYKTCYSCMEIRNAFFCSWYYTMVWEELWEVERWNGGIPMCSFNGFSQETIEELSDFFDEVNESEEE